MFRTPRKSIRLQPSDYCGTTTSFITVCCQDRVPIFRDPSRAGITVGSLGLTAESLSFLVHAYCIMPDHAHFLIEGTSVDCNVMTLVARWKQQTAYLLRGELPKGIWQRRFYDHMLRHDEDVHAVAWYIWMNPVRRGLVAAPQQYPFSGSFTVDWPIGNPPVKTWIPPWKARTECASDGEKRTDLNAPDGAPGMR